MISVIIPVYNVEKYLVRCIESICGQTYRNLEIILVDDGSTDSSGDICDNYAQKDDRIHVIHKTNGGLSDARNTGLEMARGSYISFVDSDDYIAKNMYENLMECIKKYQTRMAVCGFWAVDDEGNLFEGKSSTALSDGCYTNEKFMEMASYSEGWNFIVVWNKLYSRDIIDKIRFPVGKIHEDQYIFYDLVLACDNISVTAEKLYYYRQRNQSITNDIYSVKRLDEVEAILQQCKFFERNQNRNAFIRTERRAFMFLEEGLVKLLDEYSKQRVKEIVNEYRKIYLNVRNIEEYSAEEQVRRFALVLGVNYYIKNIEKIQKRQSILYQFIARGKSMGKLVSIVIPAYNVEKYIAICLESLVNQTYKNLEIIVIDDMSTDRTIEICETYQKKDSRIKILYQNHGGAAKARNLGIEEASGYYLMFLDSDDYMNLRIVEVLLNQLEKNNADMAVSSYTEVKEDDCGKNMDKEISEKRIKTEVLRRNAAQKQAFGHRNVNYVVPWCKLYKKSLWEGIRFPELYALEDEFTYYKVIYAAKKILYVNEDLYYYRRRSGSIMDDVPLWTSDLLKAWRERAEFYKIKQEKVLCGMAAQKVLELLQERIGIAYEKKSIDDEELEQASREYWEQFEKYMNGYHMSLRYICRNYLNLKKKTGKWKTFFRFKRMVGDILRSFGIKC